jgi:hypothetical protein
LRRDFKDEIAEYAISLHESSNEAHSAIKEGGVVELLGFPSEVGTRWGYRHDVGLQGRVR